MSPILQSKSKKQEDSLTERHFELSVLRSEAMRRRIADAMWAQRMEQQGLGGAMMSGMAGQRPKIRKAVDEILDNVILYLEDS